MKLEFLILVLALQSVWRWGTVFLPERALRVVAVPAGIPASGGPSIKQVFLDGNPRGGDGRSVALMTGRTQSSIHAGPAVEFCWQQVRDEE